MRELERAVVRALSVHPAVRSVRLIGSRARGEANEASDWDFRVETADFDAVAASLPDLVAPLEPMARQWDRLSPHWCYMLMVEGPTKIDLLFDRPHEPEPPWVPSPETLPGIDAHFWDWILWLASKDLAGRTELVGSELRKMSEHILAPLGSKAPARSIPDAVRLYRAALGRHQGNRTVDAALGTQVRDALRRFGLGEAGGNGE